MRVLRTSRFLFFSPPHSPVVPYWYHFYHSRSAGHNSRVKRPTATAKNLVGDLSPSVLAMESMTLLKQQPQEESLYDRQEIQELHEVVLHQQEDQGQQHENDSIADPSNPVLVHSPNKSSRLVYGKDDALFGYIEQQHAGKSFGSILDAGTGLHSLRWLATLQSNQHKMTSFVAVTADESMYQSVQREADALEIHPQIGHVVLGNWFDPMKYPLRFIPRVERQYDVVLADYLIGAMDGFSPYQQDQMITTLAQHVKPGGGRLYIVGLEPIPDSVTPPDNPANIICRVRQVRDACILLAGHRCYREYPLDWILRQIQQRQYSETTDGSGTPIEQLAAGTINDSNVQQFDHINGHGYPTSGNDKANKNNRIEKCSLRVVASQQFPILYRHATIMKQIMVGRSKLPFLPTVELQQAMRLVLDDLEKQSLLATSQAPGGRIQLGFDYVVVIERDR